MNDDEKKKRISKRDKARQTNGRSNGQEWTPDPKHMEWYIDYVKGTMSQLEIAVKNDVAQQTVSRQVRNIAKWIFREQLEDIKIIKAQHVGRLSHIAREAMKAWERSKLVAQTEVSKKGTSESKGKYSEASISKRFQCGDSRYLDTAMKALEDIRKVTGANAPTEIRHSGEIRFAGVTREDAIKNRIAELNERLEPSKN